MANSQAASYTPLSHGPLNPDSIWVESGLARSHLGSNGPIWIKLQVTTVLLKWVRPTCIQVMSELNMALWLNAAVQAKLQGAYINDHIYRRIVNELAALWVPS